MRRLGELVKVATKQIALLRDLSGTGPNGLVTVDEYAGKSRAKRAFAESTIATAQRISELTRGISNTLAAQPELREYGIAAAAATKELNDLAKATAKATDVTANEIKDREKSRREYKALDKKRQQRAEKLAQVEERLEASRARVSPLLNKTPQELTAPQAVDVKEFLTLTATRSQLLAFRRGRCLMRDYDGRVGPVQIDPADPALLAALDTTPNRSNANHFWQSI